MYAILKDELFQKMASLKTDLLCYYDLNFCIDHSSNILSCNRSLRKKQRTRARPLQAIFSQTMFFALFCNCLYNRCSVKNHLFQMLRSLQMQNCQSFCSQKDVHDINVFDHRKTNTEIEKSFFHRGYNFSFKIALRSI